MFIRLKKDWLGYIGGSVLDLPEEEARALLFRGIARRAKPGDYMEKRHLSGSFLEKKGPHKRRK